MKALAEKTGDITSTSLAHRIRANRQAKTANLLRQLNPVIRGWANYHRHAVAKDIFYSVDTFIPSASSGHRFEQLWHWTRRRHPKKPPHWVRRHYYSTEGNRNWVFKAVDDTCPEHSRREGNPIRLYKAFLTPVTRHIKIQGKANPFDPDWETYFEQCYMKKWQRSKWGKGKLRSLWKQQGGYCPV